MAENTIDRLDIQVQTQAQKANADLDKLVGKLERMSSSLNRLNAGGLKNLASGVDTLGRSVQNMSTVKTSDFTRLAKNIEKLGNINQAGINNTANALRQISSALTASTVSGEALKGLSDLANGISRLGYKSVSNAITNLPLLANSMRQFMQTLSTAPQVSANLIQMTNAMANLASQGSKYNSTIKSMGSAAKNLARSNNEAYKSNVSLMAGITKLTVGFYILRRAVRSAFEPTEKAMNIGETINLFQTSFKKIGMQAAQDAGMSWGSEAANAYAMSFIDQAQSFNDRITQALSLDPNTIMNYQAVFAQMSNAFGLTNKSVMNLSNSFTMLGLDMASFFNTGVEEAMIKLRAGLAGETEPLRTLGIDITEATLKMTALKYGIKGTVSEMSQAAKTQLRWLAIMDQADTVFGDMAKTIDSPANQVRILQQQLENLSRSIGTIFIPIISKVLPYVNAIFIALRRVADTIAGAMGYELPDYTGSDIYQDVTGGIDGIGDSADDSTGSVNKLKKALASFDQLNILSEGKSKGINIGGGGYPVLDDAIAKKTESYMEKFNAELDKMQNKAETLADNFQRFFEKIADKASPVTKALSNLWSAIKPFASNVGQGIMYFLEGIKDIGEKAISDWIPNGLNAIAKAINLIPKDAAIAIGGAIGGIATAVLLFKGATATVSIIKNIGTALSGALALISAHPVLAIGTALFAVAGAIVALNEAKFRSGDVGKLTNKLDTLAENAKNVNKELKELLSGQGERKAGIEKEYGAVQVLADKYFKLADQTKLTNKEQVLLKSYAQELIKKIPELSGLIDEQTGAYKGTKEEIQGLIDKTKEYYLVQAAQESLTELAKGLYEVEKTLATAQTERAKAQSVLNGLEVEYQEAMDAVSIGGEVYDKWQKTHTKSAADLYKEIKELKKSMGNYDEQITETKQYQKELNKQFDYATDYITTYSSTANKELPKVETAVNNALSNIAKTVANFKLPNLSITTDVLYKFSGISGDDPLGIISDKYKVKGYASGGQPNTGEFFMARENGIPEYVGRMGGRTTVANNADISAGIEEAAYRGYMRAVIETRSMSNSTPVVEVPLYLDGEELARGIYNGRQSYEGRMNPVKVGG